ncbi:MAG TPA: phage holin family protein [Caulobacteraceae bacterium]|jgi:putative membrane protein|nr:phage holin family protein [Caulobacteraceae bacterium]
MVRFIVQALAAALGFWVASRIVPGVHARSVASLIAAGVILGLINALVRPILILLTIPLTLLTLGLFLFVVNGITVWLTAAFLKGVDVNGLWSAILASVVITVISWVARAVVDVR